MIESTSPIDLRAAQYPDGSIRIQGAYQITDNGMTWVEWKVLPLVYVDSTGKERHQHGR